MLNKTIIRRGRTYPDLMILKFGRWVICGSKFIFEVLTIDILCKLKDIITKILESMRLDLSIL